MEHVKAMAIVVVVVVMAVFFSAAVSAQDFDAAPAPAPNVGSAAYSLGMSGAVIASSLLLSMLALFNN